MYKMYFVLIFLTFLANGIPECVVCHSGKGNLMPIGYIHQKCTTNSLCDLCGNPEGDVRVFMIGAHKDCLERHTSKTQPTEEEIRLAMLLAYIAGHEDGERQQHCFRFWKILNAINSSRVSRKTLDFVRNFLGRNIKIKDHEA